MSFSGGVYADEFTLAEVDRLIVTAPFAHVSLSSGSKFSVTTSVSDRMSWTGRIENRTLRLVGTSLSGRATPASVRVDVATAGLPVEVHVGEGTVTLSKWNHPVLVDLLKGKLIAKASRAPLQALVQNGTVMLQDHQASAKLDVFRGEVFVKKMSGDLEVTGAKVDVNIEKLQGLIQLLQYQGVNKVALSGGSLRFDNSKAALTTTEFDGRIEGFTQEGAVSILASKDPEIAVKTQTGRVSVTSRQSGAQVSATNEEGEIVGPAYLRVEKGRGARFLRGKLKGVEKGGRIELSSVAGTLVVRD